MRIAFSGAHRVGKSALIERVAEALPRYATVDEPYYLLEDDGYEHPESPSIEDFEAQLERSLEALDDASGDTLFDRCPLDILAYLHTHDDAAAFEIDDWIDRVRDAMHALDLVVFVPIEAPDRIAVAAHEDRALRGAVDDRLRELVIDDALRLELDVLTVHGDVADRVDQIRTRIAELESRPGTTTTS